MKTLSPKQFQTLLFLHDYTERKGYPPLLREVAANANISVPHARRRLYALAAKGYVEYSYATIRPARVKRMPSVVLKKVGT